MFQQVLEENEAKNGHFYLVGKQLTFADFVFASLLQMLDERHPKSLKNHIILAHYLLKLKNLPSISYYTEKYWQ